LQAINILYPYKRKFYAYRYPFVTWMNEFVQSLLVQLCPIPSWCTG